MTDEKKVETGWAMEWDEENVRKSAGTARKDGSDSSNPLVREISMARMILDLDDRVKALEGDLKEVQSKSEEGDPVSTIDLSNPCAVVNCTCGEPELLSATVRWEMGSVTICRWTCTRCHQRQTIHVHAVPHSILMTDAERLADLKARVAQFVAWVRVPGAVWAGEGSSEEQVLAKLHELRLDEKE